MCNRTKTCEECGKESECITTCSYVHDDSTIDLCPTCLKESGDFCLSCGQFCSGLESFDFIHPGYCDNCWDEIKQMDQGDDETDSWDDFDQDFIEYLDAQDTDDD